MNRNTHLVRDVIEIAKDGARFYDDAQRHIDDPALCAIFAQMAAAKRELITGLWARLRSEGEQPPSGGTVSGAIRQTYTDIAARLAKKKHEASIYVSQLEESEDRLIGEVRRAITDTDDARVRDVLESYWPRVKQSHDQMRNLKHAMAA